MFMECFECDIFLKDDDICCSDVKSSHQVLVSKSARNAALDSIVDNKVSIFAPCANKIRDLVGCNTISHWQPTKLLRGQQPHFRETALSSVVWDHVHLTCLQAKLQVVFRDYEDGHGLDKEEEGKGDAEGALAALLQPEVVSRQREQDLTGVGASRRNRTAYGYRVSVIIRA